MELFDYLMAKKGHNTHRDLFSYLLGKANQLPSEYQRLEYIESSGTQYIDTGRKSTPNTKFDFEYLSFKQEGEEFQNILGSQNSNISNRIYCQIGSSLYFATQFPHFSNHNLYLLPNGTFTTGTSTDRIKIQPNEKNHYIYDIPNKALVLDNLTCVSTSAYELTSSDYNILIFNRNDSTIPTTNLAVGRLYNFKWYESGKLVMNFIPCMRKSDNEVGLYDTIGKQFYTNQGTGKFAYKGYTFVEYIESTGTQYINTGVNADDINYAFDIDLYGYQTQSKQYPRVFGYQSDGGIFLANKFWYGANIDINSTASFGTFNDERHSIFANKDYAIVDNVKYNLNTPPTSVPKFNSNIITIFASIDGRNGAIRNDSFSKIKLYSFKIYHSNQLIRNFIPCIRNSDNAIGLYDMVNDIFYGNAGTGTFVIPNNVQLNSIQSLNTSLLSQNINDIQGEPNLDDVNEIKENLEYEEL